MKLDCNEWMFMWKSGAVSAQWKKTAELMIGPPRSKRKGRDYRAVDIADVLCNTFPENFWFITVSLNYKSFHGFSVKCKDGVGETAEWMNDARYDYNMHIYTVPKSEGYSHIDATDEERAKAKSVAKSVLLDMEGSIWRAILRPGDDVTEQKVRDEVIARLDRNGVKWMHVRVTTGDRLWADYCNSSRYVYANGHAYFISIHLGD